MLAHVLLTLLHVVVEMNLVASPMAHIEILVLGLEMTAQDLMRVSAIATLAIDVL